MSASIQCEFEDAAEDEHKQGGGNGHIHRVAHASPDTSVSELPS